MSQRKFVDRDRELRFLNERHKTDAAECIVLSGRRRVGKTSLLLEFLKTKPGIYFLASEEGDARNIWEFAHHAAQFLQDPSFETPVYADWNSLFSAFVHHAGFTRREPGEKTVLVIDEFPYLIARNPAIPSAFQKCWDGILATSPVMLILSGSSVSTMEKEVLGAASPLYGRRTGQWQVQPLPFPCIRQFVPYSPEECAMTWFVLGGIPAYLLRFDSGQPFWENIRNAILSPGAYLATEGDLLLTYEFREPANYRVIFRALASGCSTLSDICNSTGLDKGMVSKYLSVLSQLRIVHEEIPVTALPGFRKRHYRIGDPYLSFYYRYIVPNRIDLEAERTGEVLERIQGTFPVYAGRMFESLVMELIRSKLLLSDMHFTVLGRWWHKEQEIDIVGLDESSGTALFCECKWSSLSRADAQRVLSALERKSAEVRWRNDSRNPVFCLIGKHIEEKEELRAGGYRVLDLDDVPAGPPVA